MMEGAAAPSAGGPLTVKLPAFEGPLDLLLHLIRNAKVDIYDIPMAEITAQYLEYLGMMERLNLDVASEFMVMAATLMHIKSRMLLPVSEEEGEEEDPRHELVQQILEYQRYKDAAQSLRDMRDRRSLVFPRGEEGAPRAQEEVFLEVSLFDLLNVFREVLARAGSVSDMVIAPDRFSVVDKMREIVERLEAAGEFFFRDLFPPGSVKGEVIASFLALLELVRMHMIRVVQREFGADILITGAPPEKPAETAESEA
jgi:segregation and condensation protein A